MNKKELCAGHLRKDGLSSQPIINAGSNPKSRVKLAINLTQNDNNCTARDQIDKSLYREFSFVA